MADVFASWPAAPVLRTWLAVGRDVISGMTVHWDGMDVHIKLSESIFTKFYMDTHTITNRSRDIRAAHPVMDDDERTT